MKFTLLLLFFTICHFGWTEFHNEYQLNLEGKKISQKSSPTKELMINSLKELYQALVSENYILARSYFIEVDDITEEKMEQELKRILDQKELSLEGINILSDKGVFGKVEDLYGDKGLREIEKKKLNRKKCYGLFVSPSIIEVMALWDKNTFKFFRLDNVGKLE